MNSDIKVTGVRFSHNLDKLLTEIAKFRGQTKNGLITDICWDFVEQWQKEQRQRKK